MIGATELQGGLYTMKLEVLRGFPSTYIDADTVNSHIAASCNSNNVSALWHARLGHLPFEKIQLLHSHFPFISCNKEITHCDTCHFAKMRKLAFPISTSKFDACFDLIHVDIWGPFHIPSVFGHKYFLTIVDDKSRFTWVYFMK